MSDSLATVGRRDEWILAGCTLLLIAFHYLARADTIGVYSPARGWTPMTAAPLRPALHYLSAAVLLGVVPVLAARVLTGRGPAALGLGAGRWRAGLGWLAVGLPLALLAARVGAGDDAMRAVYPLDAHASAQPARFAAYALLQMLYYGAWEVCFRGVLLFGLRDRFGGGAANLIQATLATTAHFGRAFAETFAALPASLVFGAVALRCRSIWYVAIIHWVVGIGLDWFLLIR